MENLSYWLSGICFVACCALTWRSYQNARKKIVDGGAQHVVTIGVLFTFVGIAVGLWNFNTNTADMIANINIFLDGMKTAFYTSIIGMIFGLAIKYVQTGIERAHEADVKKNLAAVDDTSKQILSTLRASDASKLQRELIELVPAIKKLSEQMNAQATTFDALKNFSERTTLATEASQKNSEELLSETKNFQRQSLDNDAELKKAFDNFLQTMAKNFSENFIDALNKTIQDFNENLTRQFGENFKQLNEAVKELVEWQREYKSIVTATTDELKAINATFNADTLDKLQGALASFATTSVKNVSVQQKLSVATNDLATIVERTDKALKSIDSSLKNHLDDISTLAEKFKAEVVEVNKIAERVALDTKQYLDDFNATSAESMHIIGETIDKFKVNLNNETVKSIQTLAASLAQISGQMINNYKVLVARIAELDALVAERRSTK